MATVALVIKKKSIVWTDDANHNPDTSRKPNSRPPVAWWCVQPIVVRRCLSAFLLSPTGSRLLLGKNSNFKNTPNSWREPAVDMKSHWAFLQI